MKPRLLDLYCCQGGAARGYQRAGFFVVGVDEKPQPNYCGDAFVLMDALEAMRVLLAGGYITDTSGGSWYLADFAAIHSSPPCQFGTGVQNLGRARNGSYPADHLNLIPDTRIKLQASGRPYVIENVTGARRHLQNPVLLCGLAFNLKVYRHRWFEIVPFMLTPGHVPHRDHTPSAGNGVSPKGFISVCGSGGVRGLDSTGIMEKWSSAMGIDWMTRDGLAEAIPPAYTAFIGAHLLAALSVTP